MDAALKEEVLDEPTVACLVTALAQTGEHSGSSSGGMRVALGSAQTMLQHTRQVSNTEPDCGSHEPPAPGPPLTLPPQPWC